MTRRHTKKRPKRPPEKRTRKIIGTVINVTAQRITLLQRANGLWIFRRTSNTKVISGTLRPGSTVTLEFNRKDGKKLGGYRPGKRTEAGTVIKLTAQQINLRVPIILPGHANAGSSGTFLIDIHTPNDTVTIPPLAKLKKGSKAIVVSEEKDWHPSV